MRFRQWLEYAGSAGGDAKKDRGLRRPGEYWQPNFKVMGAPPGMHQIDPMYCTLHKCDKKKPEDKSPAATLFGHGKKSKDTPSNSRFIR